MSQNPITGVDETRPAPSIGRNPGRRTLTYEYDFAREGGAISTFFLRGPSLPENAILVDAYLDVLTVPTSGG